MHAFRSRYTRRLNSLVNILGTTILTAIVVAACSPGESNTPEFDPETSVLGSFELSSTAFADGETIPAEYTCDGTDKSPPLRWSEPPAGTKSLAVVVDDPDAPGRIFRHWSVFNIPPGTRSLSEGQPDSPELENSILQGLNDFGSTGYGGPCPPPGQQHEYTFFVYALSERLDLEGEASPSEVTAAIRGRVIGTGSFSGMYARR